MPQFKVVITGANGFLGSALRNKFTNSNKYQIYPIAHEVLENYSGLREAILAIKPDYIFHCAAFGNHSTQTEDEDIFEANVIGIWNLLQATKDIPYKAFINFGSSSEYGQKNSPMSERDLPEATSMYGCTKIAGTYLARAFAKKYDKPIVNCRLFSVYGPGEADHRFIPTVINCLLQDKVLTLYPEAKHDWIYLGDLLDALGLIVDNASLLSGQIVNIGTGQEYTNDFIVKALEIISGKNVKIKIVENMRLNDSETWQADISKLKSFKWHPKNTVIDGLNKTYQYYKNKYYGN